MPEGDTVWLAARRLHTALAGEVLLGTDFRVPALAEVDLSGRRVLEVVSRGKHLLLRVERGTTLHTHLRMDGSWHLFRRAERRRGGPDWQVRVVLTTAAWQAVGYRLPVVELLPTDDESRVVGHLGPDLLDPQVDVAEAVRRLAAAPDRAVAEALLDQRNLAGIGNLYATETCFLRGVTPWTPVGDVDLAATVELARRLLRANRDHPEQVTTGDRRRDRQHWVYGRRTCLRCGGPVSRHRLGEPTRQRLAWWCPACQRGPAPGG